MSLKKELNEIQRNAEKQGWTVEITGGGHRRWTSPEGQKVFSSFSPSDYRAIRKHIKELIKKGYVPKGLKK